MIIKTMIWRYPQLWTVCSFPSIQAWPASGFTPNIFYHTAVVNADTFAGGGWLEYSPQQSTVIDSVDDRRLCISFFTQNLQFILQHRFTCCPHFSVISKHGCLVRGQFVRDKAICRYDLSHRCHDPDDTCAYELSVYILRSDGLFPDHGLPILQWYLLSY